METGRLDTNDLGGILSIRAGLLPRRAQFTEFGRGNPKPLASLIK
jgi:hypothetical protein